MHEAYAILVGLPGGSQSVTLELPLCRYGSIFPNPTTRFTPSSSIFREKNAETVCLSAPGVIQHTQSQSDI